MSVCSRSWGDSSESKRPSPSPSSTDIKVCVCTQRRHGYRQMANTQMFCQGLMCVAGTQEDQEVQRPWGRSEVSKVMGARDKMGMCLAGKVGEGGSTEM